VHGARGNNPDQLAVAAQREIDVKQPSSIDLSESMQPDLIRTRNRLKLLVHNSIPLELQRRHDLHDSLAAQGRRIVGPMKADFGTPRPAKD
jgi:hypothetical protein